MVSVVGVACGGRGTICPASFISFSLHRLNLELRNNDGASALWLALQQLDSSYLSSSDVSEYDHTFAARLIKRGANPDAVETRTGNSLLHRAALEHNEGAAVFLVHHGAIANHKNKQGETPIHVAAMNGLHQLVKVLLENGADPNLQTALKPKPHPMVPPPLSLSHGSQSPLVEQHIAVATAASGSTDNMRGVGSSDVMGGTGSNDVMGGSILSPSTLGALNALSFTSQVQC